MDAASASTFGDGCALLVGPDALMRGAGPSASFTTPDRTALVGTTFYLRGIVNDPVAKAAGVVVTPGPECRFGAK